MLFSNYALKFVDYPTQVIAKSCKPIPGIFCCLKVASLIIFFCSYDQRLIYQSEAIFIVEIHSNILGRHRHLVIHVQPKGIPHPKKKLF